VAQNVAQVVRHAHLAASRLDGWVASGDTVVAEAREVALRVHDDAVRLEELLGKLDGFEPPAKTEPPLAPGERVYVRPEHRRRYEVRYAQALEGDPEMLDDLVFEALLETGEVLVRRGRKTPFPARKSHLARRKEAGGGA
jgi:hypothetical protein